MIYSVELDTPEVKETLSIQNNTRLDAFKTVQQSIDNFCDKHQDDSLEKIVLDKEENKIYIYSRFVFHKPLRPQIIAEKILGLKNPVYIMSRETVLFSDEKQKLAVNHKIDKEKSFKYKDLS